MIVTAMLLPCKHSINIPSHMADKINEFVHPGSKNPSAKLLFTPTSNACSI